MISGLSAHGAGRNFQVLFNEDTYRVAAPTNFFASNLLASVEIEHVRGVQGTLTLFLAPGAVTNHAEKGSPVAGDWLLISDSEAGGALKAVQVGNLPGGGGGEANLGSTIGGGARIFAGKSGVTLQFVAATNLTGRMTVVTNGSQLVLDVVEANLDIANLGGTLASTDLSDSSALARHTDLVTSSNVLVALIDTKQDASANLALWSSISTNINAFTNSFNVVGGTGGITVSLAFTAGQWTWTINDDDAGGGGTGFSTLTSGINTSADMQVGPGATLVGTNGGVLRATEVSAGSGAIAASFTGLTASRTYTLPDASGFLVTTQAAQSLMGKTLVEAVLSGDTTLSGHIIPDADTTRDLGSIDNRMRSVYTDGISWSNATAFVDLNLFYAAPARVLVTDSASYVIAHPTISTNELAQLDGVTANLATSIVNLNAASNALTNLKQPASTVGTNLAGTSAITNLSSVQFSAHSTVTTNWLLSSELWNQWDFYDDFNRPNTTNGWLGASSPSGHPYTLWHPAIGTVNTNAGRIEDGRFVVGFNPPSGTNGTVYAAFNTRHHPPHIYAARWRQVAGNGGVQLGGATLANGRLNNFNWMVHLGINRDAMTLDITTNQVSGLHPIAQLVWGAAITNGQEVVFGMQFHGNNLMTIFGNGTNMLVHHPDIDAARGTNCYFQVSQSLTNLATGSEILGVWAGGHNSSKYPSLGYGLAYNGTNGAGSLLQFHPGIMVSNLNASTITGGTLDNARLDSDLQEWAGFSTNKNAFTNTFVLAGGTGGITVSLAESGGVWTWTINDDDAGGSGLGPTVHVAHHITQGNTNATTTTPALIWPGPADVRLVLSGNTTLSFAGTPSNNNTNQTMRLSVMNPSTHTLAFPTGILWPDGEPVQQPNATNFYAFYWNGVNVVGTALQREITTGLGATVLSNAPVVSSATMIDGFYLGPTGVHLSDNGDGSITFRGEGNGDNEDFTLNLDDVTDQITMSSSTGVSLFQFDGINLGIGGSGISQLTMGTSGGNTTNFINTGGAGSLTDSSFSIAQNGIGRIQLLSSLLTRLQGTNEANTILVTNLHQHLSTLNVATNDTANSNLTVNLSGPPLDIFATNNLSLTNFTGIHPGTASSIELMIAPQLVNRTIVYPTLGAASFGVRVHTNSYSPMWTTLTNGSRYHLSITRRNTNLWFSITEWK